MTKTISIIIAFVTLSWLTVAGQQPQTTLRPTIQTIISRLKKENVLHLGAPVGFAGIPETKNKYYKLYKKLNTKATNEELVTLTHESSKVIVLYAFDILSSRGYSGLKDIFLNHVSDTTVVWMAGGCTGSVGKVNSYMLVKKLQSMTPELGPGKGGETIKKPDGAQGTDRDVTTIRPGSQAIVGGRLQFEAGSAQMGPDLTGQLQGIAKQIRGYRIIVLVKGHTSLDDFPDGTSPEKKMDLSLRRAQARNAVNAARPSRTINRASMRISVSVVDVC